MSQTTKKAIPSRVRLPARLEIKLTHKTRAAIDRAAARLGLGDRGASAYGRLVLSLAAGVDDQTLDAINLVRHAARVSPPRPDFDAGVIRSGE